MPTPPETANKRLDEFLTWVWRKLGPLTGPTSDFAAGGLVFGDANGFLTQDAAQIFWDDANKRLGLGIATPQGRAHLKGIGDYLDFGFGGSLVIEPSAADEYPSLYFRGQATDNWSGIIWTANTGTGSGSDIGALIEAMPISSTDTDLVFWTNTDVGGSAATEKMRLTHNGYLGIGTNSPSTVLHVADSSANELYAFRIENSSTGTGTSKAAGMEFYGRDTINTKKDAGKVAVYPEDNNYTHTYMSFFTRAEGDLAWPVEKARIDSKGRLSCFGRGFSGVRASQWGNWEPSSSTTNVSSSGLLATSVATDSTSSSGMDSDGRYFQQNTGATLGNDGSRVSGAVCSRTELTPIIIIKFKLGQTNDTRFFAGLCSMNTPWSADNPAGHFFGLQYSSSRGDTEFQIFRKDNVTPAVQTTSVTVDTSAHTVLIRVNSSSSVDVYLFDATGGRQYVGNFSTSLPSSSADLFVACGIETLANVDKNIRQYFAELENRK